jgi:hypothetical protein
MEKCFDTNRRYRGTSRLVICALAASALLGLAACGRAPAEPPATAATAAAELSPEQVLRSMSETLAQSKRFTFKVTRHLDAALVEGREVAEDAQIEISVARPDRLVARSSSDEGVRRLYADGTNVSLSDEKMNLYAVTPSAGTIDEMVARLDDIYGFTPPLAEFTLSDPYASIGKQIRDSSYKGLESINGVNCHHVSATGELADVDIWVAANDHLPRRLVATFNDREGSPQLRADFTEWDMSAKFDNETFAFVPPAGAEKIEMVSLKTSDAAEPKEQKRQGKQN